MWETIELCFEKITDDDHIRNTVRDVVTADLCSIQARSYMRLETPDTVKAQERINLAKSIVKTHLNSILDEAIINIHFGKYTSANEQIAMVNAEIARALQTGRELKSWERYLDTRVRELRDDIQFKTRSGQEPQNDDEDPGKMMSLKGSMIRSISTGRAGNCSVRPENTEQRTKRSRSSNAGREL